MEKTDASIPGQFDPGGVVALGRSAEADDKGAAVKRVQDLKTTAEIKQAHIASELEPSTSSWRNMEAN